MEENNQLEKIEVIRSSRRSVSLEITQDGRILVRAPYRMSSRQIREFVRDRQDWIMEHMRIVLERQKKRQQADRLSPEQMQELADQALLYFPERAAHFAPLVGVSYGRITIRNQKTRWGSCSGKGNLNFNCLLMLAPPEVRDYVVVHELCHRKEMNHSSRFWAEVARVLPDFKERQRWLKENGDVLMARMTG